MTRPTGTVVFLFTDIEGSTARWDARPDAMQEALREHDAIIRGAAANHRGYVFKTMGDAFCVAFEEGTDALLAALEAQRAIHVHDWSSVGGLHVRMALHTGQTDERSGDYFGTAVNRVARLLSAGHGGQILVSGALAETLGAQPAQHISLRALGSYRLKDLREAERIFQVVAPDLPVYFKPLRTLEAVENNLPQQTTAFIGRERDIAGIVEAMRTSTLVTIAGPGGVGKTRTAIQCAAETIDSMADGVWFVNFAPIRSPSLLVTTMLHALKVPVADADPLQALLAHLATREALIVLDNCEQLVHDVAALVAEIRANCSRVTILATSREVLHLDGERVYRLPPMGASDSLRLFVQRAQNVSGFEFDERGARTIEAICERLDGIPLAIELAAARARVLSLGELLDRLKERFRILTGGSRTALPRQQTLRALIDWSYELLTEPEKTLFRRLSVFTGGFTVEAASTVCRDDALDEWAILDLISSLADKSLAVQAVDQPHRYYLLESIREYARGKLDETVAVADRHAAYFADLAAQVYEEWDRTASVQVIAPARVDLDNLRSALRWTLEERHNLELGAALAANCGPLFIQLSLLSEGSGWCTRAIDRVPQAAACVRARLEYVLSMFFNNQAAYKEARVAAECAVALFRQTNDERGTIRALSQAAQQNARAKKFDRARAFAEEAMDRAGRSGDSRLFASVTRRCAFSLPPSEIEAARTQFAAAVQSLRSMAADEEACQMLEWWAEAEAAAGCFQQAMRIGIEALNCADDTAQMHRASNIAGYALAAGDFERAEPFTQQALALALRAQHPILTAVAIAYLAPIRAREDPHEAARLFGYASAQMAAAKWHGIASDRRARDNIRRKLRKRIDANMFTGLLAEGAAWSADEALAHVRR